jgi:ABC-2 type transport system ATP-binding protein
MNNKHAVEAQDLCKLFGDFKAVQGVSFAADTSEVFSLLGPNGAGKSTIISMLSGLLPPSSGDARIMGHSICREPEAAKASLGVVPQDIALYPDLSARENLEFWGKMYGLRGAPLRRRVDEVLDIIGLAERQKDRVGKFSGGMKRRVNIGVALLHKPAVVIMDEPTVGIDPQSRRHILDNVKALNKEGMTVLYTTHYMEEAAELSNQIAIMDAGKVIACGTHAELIRLVGEQTRLELKLSVIGETVVDAWRKIDGISQASAVNGAVTVLAQDSNFVLPRLFDSGARLGARITAVDIQEPNLESVFLQLTGKALRD